MQYFVTFTLLRKHSPELFVSGNGTDGRQTIQERLTFQSTEQLRERLSIAGLPEALVEHDLSSPLLVSGEELRSLGIVVSQP